MIIHTVKKGESLYSIAEKYGVSPRVIEENNSLSQPQRLSIGRELLILMPTKTYTARRGDTVEDICKRFSVRKEDILKNNPSLSAMAKLYPEEMLCIKYPERSHGLIFTVGYLYDGCNRERLCEMMRYLSEVALCSAVYERGRVKEIFRARAEAEEIKKQKLRLSLRIYPRPPYTDGYFTKETIAQFINAAKEIGADGIILPLKKAVLEKVGVDFIKELDEALGKENITLTIEVYKNADRELMKSIKRSIVCRDTTLEKAMGEEEDEFKEYNELYTKITPQKTMLDLSPFAYLDKEAVPIDTALYECEKKSAEIFSESDDILNFKLGEKRCLLPSLKYVKAKLDTIAELGFMGVCIDILRCPRSHIMTLSSLFHICHENAYPDI